MVVKGTVVERNPSKTKIIGVDSSSTAIAWTYLKDGILVSQGKIDLKKKSNMNDKLREIYAEWTGLLEEIQPDHVFVEKSIFVRSPGTARTLSYIVGALMVVSLGNGYDTTDVEPSTWKAYFGYRNVTSKFNKEVAEVLGRIEAKKFCDKMRKSQTWRVIAYNFPKQAIGSLAECDHDIADSWGVAIWGYHIVSTPVVLEITNEIRYDMVEMTKLGLNP
jgi:Holliday junction resolvasome RuvABC endonuclease subunit